MYTSICSNPCYSLYYSFFFFLFFSLSFSSPLQHPSPHSSTSLSTMFQCVIWTPLLPVTPHCGPLHIVFITLPIYLQEWSKLELIPRTMDDPPGNNLSSVLPAYNFSIVTLLPVLLRYWPRNGGGESFYRDRASAYKYSTVPLPKLP